MKLTCTPGVSVEEREKEAMGGFLGSIGVGQVEKWNTWDSVQTPLSDLQSPSKNLYLPSPYLAGAVFSHSSDSSFLFILSI